MREKKDVEMVTENVDFYVLEHAQGELTKADVAYNPPKVSGVATATNARSRSRKGF